MRMAKPQKVMCETIRFLVLPQPFRIMKNDRVWNSQRAQRLPLSVHLFETKVAPVQVFELEQEATHFSNVLDVL